ncbi:NET1-associated nuclear protein 1 [Malassezia caprae]|uniref:NET1-associated nuclear protein 1 n=1 Tax=Malassezia caprae TaxID=1381934 RepID=A0AAF0E931_9BASI|nr:NET1-associated nuclear protein 1 [Malassezia caprae]
MAAKTKESVPSPGTPKPPAGEPATEKLPWIALQDESISHIPPLFTRDGSYMFLVQDTTVLIVSRLTNRVVTTLSGESTPEDQRHTAPITGMELSSFNPLQLITTSLDGTMKTWDYLDSELHDNVQVGHAVVSMSASMQWKNRLFVAVCKRSGQASASDSRSKEASSTIYSVQLGRSSPRLHKPSKLVRLGKTRPVSHLSVSPDGRWLIATSLAKVHVLDLNDTSAGFTKYATESRITALVFHPDKQMARFATGEQNGKIKIWHCLELTNDPSPARVDGSWEPVALTTTLHWHSHAVSALQYTPDGSQLLSGGEEAVLVLWKLNSGHAGGSDGREFVPRLGAPILALAVASGYEGTEQEYVARLADGSTSFIASLSLKPTRTFSTIKLDSMRALLSPEARAKLNQPLAYDPASGQLVLLAGHPSTLQFIDLATRTHIRDMEVVPSNRVSRPEAQLITPPAVQHVVFSAPKKDVLHAEWMATLDGRDSGTFTAELSLKLWQWDARSKTYMLNTRIDYPHEGAVTSMAFSPLLSEQPLDSFLLATTGTDGQVKTWRMATRTLKGARTELFWVCRSSFAYRDTTPQNVTWAPDGSLLAVSQGPFITLWDPHTLVMQAHLSSPDLKQVSSSLFVGRKGRYLAVLGSQARLLVWDLVFETVVWSSGAPVQAQVAYAEGLLAARSVAGATVLEYIVPRTQSVDRVYTVSVELGPNYINASVDSAPEHLCLMALRQSGTLVGVGDGATRPIAPSASLHKTAMENARATLFDELFGLADVEHARVQEVLDEDAQRMQTLLSDVSVPTNMELFTTPAHLLPPMSSLLDSFVDAILPTASVPAPSLPVRQEAAAPMAMDEPVTPRLDALDHVAKARDADISHLTAVFDQLMAAPRASEGVRAPSRSSKSKRKVSRSM